MPAELDACVRTTMADGKTEEEAFAICTAALQKAGKLSVQDVEELKEAFMKKKKQKVDAYGENLNSVEILKVGDLPERGLAFTLTDLHEIVKNTTQLLKEGLHNPPGKLGHDDDQAFARMSGLPATGWVERLRVVRDKLVADFTDVPIMLKNAIKKKLFRKISPEVYPNFHHPSTHQPMGKVLRAVAFLGADIPQVKGLADYMGEDRPEGAAPQLYDYPGGEYYAMGEIEIRIITPDPEPEPLPVPVVIPNNPETPVVPIPDPLVAEGLAGRDLELFRQGEKIQTMFRGKGEEEFLQDEPGLNALLRFVGRVSGAFCAGSQDFRDNSDNPEELCAFLEGHAQTRGFISSSQLKEEEMDDKKTKELEVALAEAQSKSASSEKEAITLKEQIVKLNVDIVAGKKADAVKRVNEFVEKNKETITPALEPHFRALCEAAGDGQVVVKLGEGKEQKMSALDAVIKFTEDFAKAKIAKFGELAPGASKDLPVLHKRTEGEARPEYHADLAEAAIKLQSEDKDLSYGDAVNKAIKAQPELAQG